MSWDFKSWDFSMKRPTEPDEYVGLDECAANYTSNVQSMFKMAFQTPKGICCLHQQVGSVCVGLLNHAIDRMVNDSLGYTALNPPNGWGDYKSALALLQKLRSWCVRWPAAKMAVH